MKKLLFAAACAAFAAATSAAAAPVPSYSDDESVIDPPSMDLMAETDCDRYGGTYCQQPPPKQK